MDFECFLHAMEGKKPKTVITNGDLAMREAIDIIFTSTIHHLCSLYIQRNLNLNIQDSGFQNVSIVAWLIT